MKIVFRYDDYSELSDIKTDISVFNAILDHGFNLMVGVIPAIASIDWEIGNSIPLKKLSKERINLLREYSTDKIEIALHGYTHQTITRFSGLSEFGDALSLNRQIERIYEGKKFLEDSFNKPVNWFIPPWNAYGKKTLDALQQCGITGLSGDASAGEIEEGLNYIPITCQITNVTQAIECSKKDPDSHIVVMLHGYDFSQKENDNKGLKFSEFEAILKKIKALQIEGTSFDLLAAENNCNASRAILNQKIYSHMNSLLRLISHPGTSKIYWGGVTGEKLLKRLNEKKLFVDKLYNLSYYLKKIK